VTLSRGKVVWQNDQLDTERGRGVYVDRPCWAPYWSAQKAKNRLAEPTPVERVLPKV
jgi:dihydropyrimidinase